MTLRSYLYVLRERWRIIAIFTLLAVAWAALITLMTPKVFEARAQVFVAANGTTDPTNQYEAGAFVQTQVATFADIVGSPEVLRFVKRDLNLAMSDAELKGKLRAAAPSQRALVNIYATDNSPSFAAALANSAARGFSAAIKEYMTPAKSETSTVQLYVTDPALAPVVPIQPKPTVNISLGLLLGLLIGIALAVMREVLDVRIKDPDRLADAAKAPVLGVIAEDSKAKRHVIAARTSPRSMRAENYRQLRANLQFTNVDRHRRVIAVTSSIPSEGKTTTAMNLAWTLAETGCNVCLVDADLRRPSIAEITGLISSVGLTSVLTHSVDLADAIQSAGVNFSIITAGPTPPNPSELLGSATMRDIIRRLAAQFDYVILDTAPLLPVADGAEVAAIAEGALVVARYKVTTDAMVRRAIRTLKGVDATLLGMVLNQHVPRRGSEYRYTHYSYSTGRPAHAPGEGRRLFRRSPQELEPDIVEAEETAPFDLSKPDEGAQAETHAEPAASEQLDEPTAKDELRAKSR